LPGVGPVVSVCGTVPYNPIPIDCSFDVPLQAAVVNALSRLACPSARLLFHPIGARSLSIPRDRAGAEILASSVGGAALGNTLTSSG